MEQDAPSSSSSSMSSDLMNIMCQILQVCADAFQLACMYQSSEAISSLQRLPPHQFNTGWAQSLLGRCYFEMVKYQQAIDCFVRARKVHPL